MNVPLRYIIDKRGKIYKLMTPAEFADAMEDIMPDVLSAFARVSDAAMKAAAAQKQFKRELSITMFRLLAAGYPKMFPLTPRPRNGIRAINGHELRRG